MNIIAALIYWIVVAVWLTVLAAAVIFYLKNPPIYGTTRLLIVVLSLDTLRNLVENVYFGFYFGGVYGIFPASFAKVLGHPFLLVIPKLVDVAAGCLVLGLLLLHWLPAAIGERRKAEEQARDLHRLATTDELTGLFNRRRFLALAAAEWRRFQRYRRPLSLLMLDVDRFKSINDHYGHDAGDRVLAHIAQLCRNQKRSADVIGRLGGEEFAVLLPETDLEEAGLFAERLRRAVAEEAVPIAGGAVRVTLSIGASEARRARDLADLMRQADLALYEAKRTGRNRVCCAARPPAKLSALRALVRPATP
jgi:diguanylate cyclase (GGDEF)-like protein